MDLRLDCLVPPLRAYVVLTPLLPHHPAIQQLAVALNPARHVLVRLSVVDYLTEFRRVYYGHGWCLDVGGARQIVAEQINAVDVVQAC